MTLAALLAAMLMAAPQVVEAATIKYGVSGTITNSAGTVSPGTDWSFTAIVDDAATDTVPSSSRFGRYDPVFSNASFTIGSEKVDISSLSFDVADSTNPDEDSLTTLITSNQLIVGQPGFLAFFDERGENFSSDLLGPALLATDYSGGFLTVVFTDNTFLSGIVTGRFVEVISTGVAPIPLPPAMALLLSGLGILGVMRHRAIAFSVLANRSAYMTMAVLSSVILLGAPQAAKSATFQYTGSGALYDVVDFGGSPFSIGDTFGFDFVFDFDQPFNDATNGIQTYFLDLVQASFVIDGQQVYSTNGGPGVTVTATVANNPGFSGLNTLSVTIDDINDPNFAFANVTETGDDAVLTSLDLISAFKADFNGPATFRLEDFGFASFVEGSVINRTFSQLDKVAPIPLPPALALLFSGLGILGVMRYRGTTARGSAQE